MELDFAFLVGSAELTDGKFAIHTPPGLDLVFARHWPTTMPGYLVARIYPSDPLDPGLLHEAVVRVTDAAGNLQTPAALYHLPAQVNVTAPFCLLHDFLDEHPGFDTPLVQLPAPGDYFVELLIDQQIARSLPLHACEWTPQLGRRYSSRIHTYSPRRVRPTQRSVDATKS